ncbi:MAG TPA: hypothetical protein VJ894_02935 [Cryomorphaceae bacterium]|nr:hypothetical protein [Cryomorphaceae bacterium]
MKLTIIFTTLLAFCTVLTKAEVVEKTEEKAKQKTERRIDQKIDNGIDSGLDAIEGLFSKKKKKKKEEEEVQDEAQYSANKDTGNAEETKPIMKTMGKSDVQVQDEYKFDHRFVILMENFNKKGKLEESNEMTFMTKDESSVMGMVITQEGIQTEMIYDLMSYEIVTLMTVSGQKMGTTMSIDKAQVESMMSQEESEEVDMDKVPTFKKTGKTKTISGYSCEEYIVENIENNDGNTIVYWFTTELDTDWIKSMSNMSGVNGKMPDMYAGSGYPEDGAVVQMIMDQKNGERMVMTMKDAETNQDITISTKGYTFMNMPGR